MKWLPIEEAPKDGRDLVGFIPKYGGLRIVIHWSNGHVDWVPLSGRRMTYGPTYFLALPEENPRMTP